MSLVVAVFTEEVEAAVKPRLVLRLPAPMVIALPGVDAVKTILLFTTEALTCAPLAEVKLPFAAICVLMSAAISSFVCVPRLASVKVCEALLPTVKMIVLFVAFTTAVAPASVAIRLAPALTAVLPCT